MTATVATVTGAVVAAAVAAVLAAVLATRVAVVMATVVVPTVTTATAAMAAMAAAVAAAMVAATAAARRRSAGSGGDGGDGGGSGGGKEAAIGVAGLAAACGRIQEACGSESVQDRQKGRCMCGACRRGASAHLAPREEVVDDGPKAGPTNNRTSPAPTLSETGTPVWDLLNMAATAVEIQRRRR